MLEEIDFLENYYDVRAFAKESNKIEGIFDEAEDRKMIKLLQKFLIHKNLTSYHVANFAKGLGSRCNLRDREGMDVRIGDYLPLKGGRKVIEHLNSLFDMQNDPKKKITPFKFHQHFEALHPFMDGNGRTGRAIWLWQMLKEERNTFLGFLHIYYYQSLKESDR